MTEKRDERPLEERTRRRIGIPDADPEFLERLEELERRIAELEARLDGRRT